MEILLKLLLIIIIQGMFGLFQAQELFFVKLPKLGSFFHRNSHKFSVFGKLQKNIPHHIHLKILRKILSSR